MKLISLFLLLFLIISINSESLLDAYSINLFIKNLQNNGLFDIIKSIKKVYGQDVAIISCEELNEKGKGNCKKLVSEYMPLRARTRSIESVECIENLYFSRIIKNSNNIFDIKKDILKRKYNENEATIIYNKIIKRAGNLPICFYIK